MRIGDTIHIIGKKTGVVRQKIESMQIDRKNIEIAERGQVVGLKTVERVRPGDKVYVMKEIEVEDKKLKPLVKI